MPSPHVNLYFMVDATCYHEIELGADPGSTNSAGETTLQVAFRHGWIDFGLHQGNVPSYPTFHGCIRVPLGNAAKLFTMTETGDRVRIIL